MSNNEIDFSTTDLGGFGYSSRQPVPGLSPDLQWKAYSTQSEQDDIWSALLKGNPVYTVGQNDPRFRELVLTSFFNNYDAEYLQNSLAATNWGRAILLQMLDVAGRSGIGSGISDAQQRANLVATLSDTASQLGIQLTPERAQQIANDAVSNKWDNAQIVDSLMADIDPTALVSGDITATANELQTFASGNRYTISAETAVDMALRIARGELSIAGAEDEIRSGAIAASPKYGELIRQGIDLNTYDTNVTSVTSAATRFGITLDQSTIDRIARDATTNSWTDQQITQQMLSGITSSTQLSEGTITGTRDAVMGAARNFLLPMSEQSATDIALRQLRGELDEAGIASMMKSQAKANFSFIGDLIDQGLTPMDYFTPGRERLAMELEMNPEDIDLMNSDWVDALTMMENGQRRGATYTEIARKARTRSEWANTESAQGALQNAVSAVAGLFGLRGY